MQSKPTESAVPAHATYSSFIMRCMDIALREAMQTVNSLQWTGQGPIPYQMCTCMSLQGAHLPAAARSSSVLSFGAGCTSVLSFAAGTVSTTADAAALPSSETAATTDRLLCATQECKVRVGMGRSRHIRYLECYMSYGGKRHAFWHFAGPLEASSEPFLFSGALKKAVMDFCAILKWHSTLLWRGL